MREKGALTTTGYAILGLLALRPWSTYALAQQMRRSLHYVWPRAESNVYAEPKKLVAGGYATAATEATGRRERTTYTITPAGRRALAEWLATPSAPAAFESEALLKILFAEHGSRDDLLRTLEELEHQTRSALATWEIVAGEQIDHGGQFPERAHVNALMISFVRERHRAQADWAAAAHAAVAGWADTTPRGKPPIEEIIDSVSDRLGRAHRTQRGRSS